MKTFFITCLLSLLAISAHSQPKNARQQKMFDERQEKTREEQQAFRERIKAQRVAFFTERMALTPAEAEKFWPLYNTYQSERNELIREINEKTRPRGPRENTDERPLFDFSNLSDAEAKHLVANKTKQIELEMKFHNDLTKMFSPQRVLAFYDADRSFQRKLMDIRSRKEINREGERRRR
jgi:hypothetical protein